MSEIDIDAVYNLYGVTAWTTPFKRPTRAIHSNADQTIYVQDRGGSITKKVLVAGITYVGEYMNISDDSTFGKLATGTLNCIF